MLLSHASVQLRSCYKYCSFSLLSPQPYLYKYTIVNTEGLLVSRFYCSVQIVKCHVHMRAAKSVDPSLKFCVRPRVCSTNSCHLVPSYS